MLHVDDAVGDADNFALLPVCVCKILEVPGRKNMSSLLCSMMKMVIEMAELKKSHFSPVVFARRKWLLIKISV